MVFLANSQTPSSLASDSVASPANSQTPSSSASDSIPTSWDVFLNFHGPDTRYKFVSHLYAALDRYGVRTFMDDPELHDGEEISVACIQAIKESKTYIVVLSENYASSTWCLDELVEIFNCCKSKHRLVIPVFYYIDPSAVRRQIGSFQEAFDKFKIHFDIDQQHKWRVALANLVNISGYRVLENMYQSYIINNVVDAVILQINPLHLDVAKHPVGLEARVKDMTTLMSSDTESVTRIGIHGMGGVGKTTLAKAVYNQIYHHFQGSCFLANVREVSRTGRGVLCLQQQLINDVLKYRNIKINNVDQGIELIKARICSIKVLIVIDDLDDPKLLKFLVGPFALGSILIITTRNEDLLDSIKVESRYKVKELDDAESRQLFLQHAFVANKISDKFMELSEEILKHAGGLPLALRVYGSRLSNQSEEEWKIFIDALKRVSVTEVEEKLLISFEALEMVDPMLQDIFLDISCFFIGWKKEAVVKIMETYYTFVTYYIDILKKRCLLMVNDKDELEMHDLLQDMGKKIALNNSPHEPGKHSRLWISKDICYVLKQHMGTEAIEGIIPSYQDVLEEVSFSTETFKSMSTLRFLYLREVELTGSFEQIFEDLRWLCWNLCPLKCLPSDFYPQKLVILALRHSNIRTMWEPNMVTQVFENLTTLDMSYSVDLTTTPDFTKLPCLENTSFEGCESLEEVHVSIGSLLRLVSLNLGFCVSLKRVPESICNFNTLKSLNIGGCSGLEALPIDLGNIESLTELNVWGLNVSILPDSIRHLSKFLELNLSDNKYVETSSSSALTSPTPRWDVYLSFGGIDIRDTFTDHLYRALHRTGIRTFRDDPKLRCEQVMSDSLIQAIKESKTYIVVFSENYASSRWCLDELVEILSCHQTTGRLVIPVFYNIDPSVVRHPNRIFKKAFEKHETRFAGEMEKINNWRIGLRKLADFSGLCISELSHEPDIIEEIVHVILREINPMILPVARYPVGLNSRVKDITALLSSDTEGVIKIGLYGISGVGKTTLAKALYNILLLKRSFKGSCFLANVREVSGTEKGLLSLLQQLINDVLKSKKRFKVHNAEEGTSFIRKRFCSSKLLLLVDDIDGHEQFKSLVGPFASGSIVIITTRDEDILDKIGVELKYRYRVDVLNDAESLELFTQHAFGNVEPHNTIRVLSDDILQFASGLPLALEVLGSYLSTQSEEGWKAYIDKLRKVPKITVHKILMISLDALESYNPMLKKIFLDIACFFIGWKKQDVVKIMETYYSDLDHNIDILKKRCVLTVNNREELRMHNMLQDIGTEIVRNNSHDEPRKFSRLWLSTDIFEVLKKQEGTKEIEGIIPGSHYYQYSLEQVSFAAETFKRMSKLRFLYLQNVNLTGSFEQTFVNLRWLSWDFCPLNCLPSEFYPQNLVTLELRNSKMKTLWDLSMVSHGLEKLKTLNMSYSHDLTTTPDFTKLPYLENLNLKRCESLEEVHESVGSLARLVSLDLHGCVKLRSLPDTICNLRALKVLNLGQCTSLEALPKDLGDIRSLTKLKAYELTVCELPDSVGCLSKLVELRLCYNKYLKTLPNTICDLISLENLNFGYCGHLLAIPELPPNLKFIVADGCTSMETLPNLSNLKRLEELDLTDCSALTKITGLEELTSIRLLNLGGCVSCLPSYTEQLFQIYSGLGHEIIICTKFPDWISLSSNRGSTVSLELLPNVSHNFLGMVLCFKSFEDSVISYSVKNTNKDFVWSSKSYIRYHTSLMIIVPKSIFSISDGDEKIELTADAEILGIHLMHKNECDGTIVNVERNSTFSLDECDYTKPASSEDPSKLWAKMTKSASGHFEKSNILEAHRPVTVREREAKVMDHGELNAQVEAFTKKFKQDMKLQRMNSILRYKDMISRDAK